MQCTNQGNVEQYIRNQKFSREAGISMSLMPDSYTRIARLLCRETFLKNNRKKRGREKERRRERRKRGIDGRRKEERKAGRKKEKIRRKEVPRKKIKHTMSNSSQFSKWD